MKSEEVGCGEQPEHKRIVALVSFAFLKRCGIYNVVCSSRGKPERQKCPVDTFRPWESPSDFRQKRLTHSIKYDTIYIIEEKCVWKYGLKSSLKKFGQLLSVKMGEPYGKTSESRRN